ncbi:MAG: LytTR family DNA-binding domain-containing protein [Salegentibacter sp.]|uniref:Two component transcriptional regulator, LytTR family n=1 Tax=Salegentibacter flavus TaxID=287099 RepID=A0A1I5AFA2_9FLAO|nr:MULTISPECIES: LytTR family DNA-binding domain-containing protein [Salegentibacter]MDR9457111.1 LytTR family DNA-binding domain-containing protein [Salegentibacter sp.]SFN61134.1 two component transcriptional regulator, LytTR family [Salegentibacter flavus]
MKIVIIEDEAFAADSLESMILELRPKTDVLEKLESIEEAVEWFSMNQHPDLVFCDIHLSDGNSFEIFRQTEVKCPVIFTTAYNEYAIEAFKVNSVDYLLKPIGKEELAKAIRKYEELKQTNLPLEIQNLQNLLHDAAKGRSQTEKKSRFMVKSGQSIKTISSEKVAYFLAEEGVVLLVTFEGNRFVVSYTLDQLEEMLDPKTFFRTNRQLIANIRSVKEVSPYFKGRLHLVLNPSLAGDQIISSSKASAFKDWLDL